METVAYLQLAQDYENPEPKQIKVAGKAIAAAVTVATTAWAGGLLTAAPALAYGYGCCRPRPVCCRPLPPRPVSCCRPVHCGPVCY
jgi:hypothetical protein